MSQYCRQITETLEEDNYERSELCHVLKISDLAQLQRCPLQHTAWVGLDMVRLPFNLIFSPVTDPNVYVAKVQYACKRWLPSNGMDVLSPLSGALALPASRCEEILLPSTRAYEGWLNAIRDAGDDLVVTCEDKDPSVAWLQLKHCMLFRWFLFLEQSDRWEIVVLDRQAVVDQYRAWFDDCLPNFLLTGNTKL